MNYFYVITDYYNLIGFSYVCYTVDESIVHGT